MRSKKPTQKRVNNEIQYDSTFISNLQRFSCSMCLVCLHRFELREAAKKMKDIAYEGLRLVENSTTIRTTGTN